MGLKISVIGAGYVGCVSAACLARDGLHVVTVDMDEAKVAAIGRGEAPIYEPGLKVVMEKAVNEGRLTATTDLQKAVMETDLSLVCVGTPGRKDGSLDTQYVEKASRQIGETLASKKDYHHVVMRSTLLPGSMEEIVIPAIENASGKKPDEGFGVAYYPEFLRESTAIADYDEPGAVVYGRFGEDSRTINALHTMGRRIYVKPHIVSIRSAEIIKYVNNCWHANKISFANEIGNLCKAAGIDSHVVMDVVCSDTRLNISDAYMQPGFAFGGSCLPKDLRALRAFGRAHGVETPMLDASEKANQLQIQKAYEMVREGKEKSIGMIGLTFKDNTDDLRESPLVILAERLVENGNDLTIYDPNVSCRDDGGRSCPENLSAYMRNSAAEVVANADLIIFGHADEASDDAIAALNGTSKKIIDLARIPALEALQEDYRGLCW